MSLPPVVNDPEVCPNTDEAWDPHPPHCWDRLAGSPVLPMQVCRYCGGRKS